MNVPRPRGKNKDKKVVMMSMKKKFLDFLNRYDDVRQWGHALADARVELWDAEHNITTSSYWIGDMLPDDSLSNGKPCFRAYVRDIDDYMHADRSRTFVCDQIRDGAVCKCTDCQYYQNYEKYLTALRKHDAIQALRDEAVNNLFAKHK